MPSVLLPLPSCLPAAGGGRRLRGAAWQLHCVTNACTGESTAQQDAAGLARAPAGGEQLGAGPKGPAPPAAAPSSKIAGC